MSSPRTIEGVFDEMKFANFFKKNDNRSCRNEEAETTGNTTRREQTMPFQIIEEKDVADGPKVTSGFFPRIISQGMTGLEKS